MTTAEAIDIDASLEAFHRDGFAMLPGLLDAGRAQQLKAAIDHVFDNADDYPDAVYGEIVVARLFETNNIFRDMLTEEPFITIADRILGSQCHIIANNAIRNGTGRAISDFHVDDGVEFPISEGMTRHDARLTMPVQRFSFQILLTDVATIEQGPTQYVPGSHYAGRDPEPGDNPTFEGQAPVSIFGKAGDAYLHNGQAWHRGAPNESDQTRYVLQLSYGMRHIAQRFYPFLNYRMPDHVLEGADENLLRVLGKHPKGAYG